MKHASQTSQLCNRWSHDQCSCEANTFRPLADEVGLAHATIHSSSTFTRQVRQYGLSISSTSLQPSQLALRSPRSRKARGFCKNVARTVSLTTLFRVAISRSTMEVSGLPLGVRLSNGGPHRGRSAELRSAGSRRALEQTRGAYQRHSRAPRLSPTAGSLLYWTL